MSKRQRIDTAAGQMQIMQEAQTIVEVPAHINLPADCRQHWDSIVANRLPSLWNTADLEMAATLARVKRDIERNYAALANEDDMVEGKYGPVVNPRHKLLEDLTRRAISISRAIKIHADATVGRSENLPKKMQALNEARGHMGAVDDHDDDSLIPGMVN